MPTPFAALLERFFYRPDEETGPFLALAPQIEQTPELSSEEATEEFLAFVLEHETYAVPIAAVREIVKPTSVTEVPRAPKNVIGLINVRGEMVPLYDLKVRLSLSQTMPTAEQCASLPRAARVVLVRDPTGDAGVLVDRVEGVVRLSLGRLEETPHIGGDRAPIAGLGRHHAEMIILLDVEEALA